MSGKRLFLAVLVLLVVGNVVAGLFYTRWLGGRAAEAKQALAESPQAKLKARRAELDEWQRAASDYERRAGVTLADAIQLFDAAAVGWEDITLESSPESESSRRLDVISVRGLVGTSEQLTRVDKRLGSRCRSYQRSPTRQGAYLLSCQVKPEAFNRRD